MHKLETQYVFQGKQSSSDSQRFDSKTISASQESGDDGFTSSSSGDTTTAQGLVLVDPSDTEPPRSRAKSCYDMSSNDEFKDSKLDIGIEKSFSVQEITKQS